MGGPRGPRRGPGGPRHSILDPFVSDDLSDPSGSFWSFSRVPSWDPPVARIHIKPTDFKHFCGRQGSPRVPFWTPLGFRAPPRAPHGARKKMFGRPRGPPRGAQMTEKVFRETVLSNMGGPWGPHEAPIGPHGAPGEQISTKINKHHKKTHQKSH